MMSAEILSSFADIDLDVANSNQYNPEEQMLFQATRFLKFAFQRLYLFAANTRYLKTQSWGLAFGF